VSAGVESGVKLPALTIAKMMATDITTVKKLNTRGLMFFEKLFFMFSD